MGDALTGRTANKQYRLAAAQNAESRARLEEEERKVAAVEEGQRRLKGGGRGFLAFIEDMEGKGLGETLGTGAAAAGAASAPKKRKGFGDYAAGVGAA